MATPLVEGAHAAAPCAQALQADCVLRADVATYQLRAFPPGRPNTALVSHHEVAVRIVRCLLDFGDPHPRRGR
eukprot:9509175-Alexandrium_andersonii.AAC.1